jgi:hypothetical protein
MFNKNPVPSFAQNKIHFSILESEIILKIFSQIAELKKIF